MGGVVGKIKALDPDTVFAYKTPRIAVIQDRRLGLLNLALTLGIAVYIVFVVIVDQGYLLRAAPSGSVRMSIRAPPAAQLANFSTLPYCVGTPDAPAAPFAPGSAGEALALRLGCRRVDETEPSFVSALEGSILAPTRVNETHLRAVCADRADLDAACAGYVPIPELESSYFVSEIEDFTLKLDISAAAAALGVSGNNRDLAAQVRRCDGSSFETTDTIFTLRQMLAWACIDDLDAASDHAPGESYRYAGGVLVVVAKFSNTVSLSGRHMLEMSSTLIPRTEFKATTTISSADMSTRTVLSMHGIFITVEIAGEFGIFSLPTLVVQLTASLGLLAIAKKLVDEIMCAVFFFFFFFLYFSIWASTFKNHKKNLIPHTHTHTHTHIPNQRFALPERKEYRAVKFEVSDDFSDVRVRKKSVVGDAFSGAAASSADDDARGVELTLPALPSATAPPRIEAAGSRPPAAVNATATASGLQAPVQQTVGGLEQAAAAATPAAAPPALVASSTSPPEEDYSYYTTGSSGSSSFHSPEAAMI
jgi:hypothetical protein